MRWKISDHGHDVRLNDLLAILALLILIVAAGNISARAPNRQQGGLHRAESKRPLVKSATRLSPERPEIRRRPRPDMRPRPARGGGGGGAAADAVASMAGDPSSGNLTDSSTFDFRRAPAIADAEIDRLRAPEQRGI